MAPDSSEDEWEEVTESQVQEEEEKEVKTSENVEIELEVPDLVKKRKKKKDREREEIETCIRRAKKRFIKEVHVTTHKVHLMCLLSMGMRLNQICNNEELQARAYSLLPARFTESKPKDISVMSLTRLIQDFTKSFQMKNGLENLFGEGIVRFDKLEKILKRDFEKSKINFKLDLVLIFVLALRAMGMTTRLVVSLHPITLKVLTEKQKENMTVNKGNGNRKRKAVASKGKKKQEDESFENPMQVDGANDTTAPRVTRSRARSTRASGKNKNDNIDSKIKVKNIKKEEAGNSEVKKQDNKLAATRNLKVILVKTEPTDTKIDSKVKTPKAIDETPLAKPLTRTKTKRRLRTRRKKRIVQPMKNETTIEVDEDDFEPVKSSESESDFEEEQKKISPKRRKKEPIKNLTVSSNDKNITSKTKAATKKTLVSDGNYYDEWVEVFSEQENKWLCLDVFRCAVNHPEMMEKYATTPLHYVLGFENDGTVKDVTPRYSSKWLTDTRKLRVGIVDKDWWKSTLLPYKTPNLERDQKENKDMQDALLIQPIPTTISAFKNHPLFGLRRHILKYEAIYPEDVPAVGLIRGEEIYPRSAIHTLHTRDKWLQNARCVKEGEEPYKMVASMWINMKLKQDMATLSMPLFGRWQTQPYVPPVAKDGKVPRNKYGNVDLFQPSMIPIGCVHLRLEGLQRVARKLDIDVALAITGFDSHSGYPHPVTDGYIACKEHEEVLVAAWREDQIHVAERERVKREQRIYGHWKLLIRGLLALERVKRKYALKEKDSSKDKNSKGTEINTELATSWQAKRLEAAKSKAKGRGRKKKDENLFPFEMDTA